MEENFGFPLYEINSKVIADAKRIANKIKKDPKIAKHLNKKIDKGKEIEIMKIIRGIISKIEGKASEEIVEAVFDELFGLKELGILIRDPELEEIMVNSPFEEVFVFHRKFGMCKTNIILGKGLEEIVERIAKNNGKEIIDARLNDGSRINVVGGIIAPKGIAITIRKFKRDIMSIIELIDNNTLNYEVAAFLWLAVEGFGKYPLNIIIAGSSASGKTTLLNALLAFIPYSQRIVSIEDTRELNFGKRKNYVALEARAIANNKQHTMDSLLCNALRMRPDRIIVGEVRHAEAKTLFTAMNTGQQGVMATIHANSSNDVVLRLTTNPMNVPKELMRLLDIVVFLQKENKGMETIRFVEEITEFDYMQNTVLTATIYDKTNQNMLLNISHVIEKIAKFCNKTKNEIIEEINRRAKILEWMHKNKIFDFEEVFNIVQLYNSGYFNKGLIKEFNAK